jgi:hypothetical protein
MSSAQNSIPSNTNNTPKADIGLFEFVTLMALIKDLSRKPVRCDKLLEDRSGGGPDASPLLGKISTPRRSRVIGFAS